MEDIILPRRILIMMDMPMMVECMDIMGLLGMAALLGMDYSPPPMEQGSYGYKEQAGGSGGGEKDQQDGENVVQ
jgi:hypothetical protein